MSIEIIKLILLILSLVLMVYCLYYIFRSIWHMYLTIKNVKKKVYERGYFAFGPLVLFYPELFTDEGKLHRRKSFYYIQKFILGITVTFIIFYLATLK